MPTLSPFYVSSTLDNESTVIHQRTRVVHEVVHEPLQQWVQR